MKSLSDLRCWLLESEHYYVDEIHRLNTDSAVQLFPDDASALSGGWLYLPAEPGSGDWNIARMLGQGSEALTTLTLLPETETNLLVPSEFSHLFVDRFKQQSSLIYFEGVHTATDAVDGEAAVSADVLSKSGLTLQRRAGDEAGSFALYLLAEDQIQGYVKSIRLTPNFAEVYIEVQPGMRQRGLGNHLLSLALLEAAKSGRNLIYTVDADNQASLALTRKVGLQQFLQLDRFLKV
ncbi:MAG: GNAT family N-acetyltransferase [Candidatus Riflebacteria bacterium]|nr:GNAT family N-acetyltransferase [Candidatus Riflebacteria bacterium]